MRKYLFIVIALCPFVFQACRNSQPSGYRGMPKEYNLCYEEIYGRCYDSIPYAVVALDLYSEGLELDEEHHMRGTGYNLYISDIFVPERTTADSLRLAVGEYKSDTTGEPFTFLPGRNWEGTPCEAKGEERRHERSAETGCPHGSVLGSGARQMDARG